MRKIPRPAEPIARRPPVHRLSPAWGNSPSDQRRGNIPAPGDASEGEKRILDETRGTLAMRDARGTCDARDSFAWPQCHVRFASPSRVGNLPPRRSDENGQGRAVMF